MWSVAQTVTRSRQQSSRDGISKGDTEHDFVRRAHATPIVAVAPNRVLYSGGFADDVPSGYRHSGPEVMDSIDTVFKRLVEDGMQPGDAVAVVFKDAVVTYQIPAGEPDNVIVDIYNSVVEYPTFPIGTIAGAEDGSDGLDAKPS